MLILGIITVQILQVKTISGDHPLLEFVYLNKYSISSKISEWKFTFKSVRFARSGRNAYREELNWSMN